jgi:hypothetical protein
MENVKEFMLLFRMEPGNTKPTDEQIASMHQQWQKYIGQLASQEKLVNVSRLGFDGVVVSNNQSIKKRIVLEDNLAISGNLTIKGTDMEEVIETAKSCPVLFAGGTVEVRPIIPMN